MTACVKWQVCSKPLHNPTPNGLVGENILLTPIYVPQSLFPYVTSHGHPRLRERQSMSWRPASHALLAHSQFPVPMFRGPQNKGFVLAVWAKHIHYKHPCSYKYRLSPTFLNTHSEDAALFLFLPSFLESAKSLYSMFFPFTLLPCTNSRTII